VGDFSDSFSIPSNDPDEATVTIAVSGSGDQSATLVIDGGSSALDPWSLAFLGGLPFLRRRRRAAAMKLAMAAAAGVLAAPAVMAADDRWDWDYDGVYLGAGAIGTSLQTSSAFNSTFQSELGLLGIPSSGGFEDFPLGGQLYAGWMFTNMWGMEIRWSDSGNGSSDIFLVDNAGARTRLGDVGVSIDGFTLYGVGNWPVAERWDLFGKLGYTRQDAAFDASVVDGGEGSPASFAASDDDVGPAAALGARWRFARHWASTAEVEYLGVDFDNTIDAPWRLGLNVEYWFGGQQIAAAAPVAAAAVVDEPPPPPPAAPPAAPVDSDGDGVVDGSDQCADTPSGDRVGPVGCSCDVTRQLTFKTDSSALSDADKLVLDEMAENLTRLKFISGVIEGHTDSVGADAYNQGLSERRAQAAADYLAAKGISSDRMQIVGRGETDPVGDNTTAEGRAQNRRVVAKRTDCDK
jgi:outer membrane protein OmpA-like peptidoglycan-associated protein